MAETDTSQPAQPAAEPTVKDFLKRHVRGVPHEKLKSKVLYGFKYKDLKAFISDIISRHAGADNAEMLKTISELELKLQSAKQYKERMEEQSATMSKQLKELQEGAEGAASSEELDALKAERERLAGELTALQTHKESTEAAHGEASEELARLKEEHDKLEKESEFLDQEMEKLNAKTQSLEDEAARLREQLAEESEAGEKALAEAAEKMAALQAVIDQSKDMQKFQAMQAQVKELRRCLDAWEEAGAFVAAERVPDYDASDAAAAEVLSALEGKGDAAWAGELASLVEALRRELGADRERLDSLLASMYEFKGGIDTAYELGQIAGADRASTRHIDTLRDLVSKLT